MLRIADISPRGIYVFSRYIPLQSRYTTVRPLFKYNAAAAARCKKPAVRNTSRFISLDRLVE
jgi:hypothetical protein